MNHAQFAIVLEHGSSYPMIEVVLLRIMRSDDLDPSNRIERTVLDGRLVHGIGLGASLRKDDTGVCAVPDVRETKIMFSAESGHRLQIRTLLNLEQACEDQNDASWYIVTSLDMGYVRMPKELFITLSHHKVVSAWIEWKSNVSPVDWQVISTYDLKIVPIFKFKEELISPYVLNNEHTFYGPIQGVVVSTKPGAYLIWSHILGECAVAYTNNSLPVGTWVDFLARELVQCTDFPTVAKYTVYCSKSIEIKVLDPLYLTSVDPGSDKIQLECEGKLMLDIDEQRPYVNAGKLGNISRGSIPNSSPGSHVIVQLSLLKNDCNLDLEVVGVEKIVPPSECVLGIVVKSDPDRLPCASFANQMCTVDSSAIFRCGGLVVGDIIKLQCSSSEPNKILVYKKIDINDYPSTGITAVRVNQNDVVEIICSASVDRMAEIDGRQVPIFRVCAREFSAELLDLRGVTNYRDNLTVTATCEHVPGVGLAWVIESIWNSTVPKPGVPTKSLSSILAASEQMATLSKSGHQSEDNTIAHRSPSTQIPDFAATLSPSSYVHPPIGQARAVDSMDDLKTEHRNTLFGGNFDTSAIFRPLSATSSPVNRAISREVRCFCKPNLFDLKVRPQNRTVYKETAVEASMLAVECHNHGGTKYVKFWVFSSEMPDDHLFIVVPFGNSDGLVIPQNFRLGRWYQAFLQIINTRNDRHGIRYPRIRYGCEVKDSPIRNSLSAADNYGREGVLEHNGVSTLNHDFITVNATLTRRCMDRTNLHADEILVAEVYGAVIAVADDQLLAPMAKGIYEEMYQGYIEPLPKCYHYKETAIYWRLRPGVSKIGETLMSNLVTLKPWSVLTEESERNKLLPLSKMSRRIQTKEQKICKQIRHMRAETKLGVKLPKEERLLGLSNCLNSIRVRSPDFSGVIPGASAEKMICMERVLNNDSEGKGKRITEVVFMLFSIVVMPEHAEYLMRYFESVYEILRDALKINETFLICDKRVDKMRLQEIIHPSMKSDGFY